MRVKNNDFNWNDEINGEIEEITLVSKSKIKRDAEQLKKLGVKLVQLNPISLEKIPVDEKLLDAINQAKNMKRESLRRQLQYIGKLLRNIDVEPIKEVLEKIENPQQNQLQLRKLEQLREQLLANDNQALSELFNSYPNMDRQYLRNLIRAGQKERLQNKSNKFYQEIFQYLKQFMLAD